MKSFLDRRRNERKRISSRLPAASSTSCYGIIEFWRSRLGGHVFSPLGVADIRTSTRYWMTSLGCPGLLGPPSHKTAHVAQSSSLEFSWTRFRLPDTTPAEVAGLLVCIYYGRQHKAHTKSAWWPGRKLKLHYYDTGSSWLVMIGRRLWQLYAIVYAIVAAVAKTHQLKQLYYGCDLWWTSKKAQKTSMFWTYYGACIPRKCRQMTVRYDAKVFSRTEPVCSVFSSHCDWFSSSPLSSSVTQSPLYTFRLKQFCPTNHFYGRLVLMYFRTFSKLLFIYLFIRIHRFNPFTANLVKALHFAILVSNPLFLIFDIRALWRSGLSARAPECQKLKMVG